MQTVINIVILTTRGGHGLISGSEGLKEAFIKKYGQKCNIFIIDFFKKGSTVGYLLTEFYNFFIRNSLFLSSVYIKLVNKLRLDKWKCLKTSSLNYLLKIVTEYQPSIIIVTSQYLISFVGSVSNELAPDIRVYSANIDPGSECIPLWFDHNIDMHILPSNDTKEAYLKYGFPEQKALITALVVRQRFIEIMKFDKMEIRSKLNIPPDCFAVLLTGSREGNNGMINIAKKLSKEKGLYLIVIAGTNSKLERKLKRMSKKFSSLKLIGWTDEPEKMMRVSDVIISKPGKQTMKESIAAGIPLISITYPRVMEQEISNIEFLKRRKISFEAKSPQEIVNIVKTFKNNQNYYEHVQKRIKLVAESEINPDKTVAAIWNDYHQNC